MVLDTANNTALKVGQIAQNARQLHSLKHFYIETSLGPMGKGCSSLIQLQGWPYLLILPTCIREMWEGSEISQQEIPSQLGVKG